MKLICELQESVDYELIEEGDGKPKYDNILDFIGDDDDQGDLIGDDADVDANQAAIEAALAAEVAATNADFSSATAARTSLSQSIESTMASNASTAAAATAAVAADLASYETSNDAALAVETGRLYKNINDLELSENSNLGEITSGYFVKFFFV